MSEYLESLRSFPSRLSAAVAGVGDEGLVTIEKPGAWSIANVLAHLDDFELMTALRVRMMVAEDRPRLPLFSQEPWVERFHSNETAAEVLHSVIHRRQANLRLIESLSAEELSRVGEHPQAGEVTLARLLQMAVDHQEKHLLQIERIKRATETSARLP